MYYTKLSTAQMIQNGLEGVYRNQAIAQQAMDQMSSAVRTDLDPVEQAQLLNYKVSISNSTQNNRNIDNITPKLEAQEGSITFLQDELNRLQDLLMAQNNDLTASNKKYYEQEYIGIKNNILERLNSKDINGQYLFSGYQSGIKPFDSQFNYLGDQGVNTIRIGNHASLETNIVGDLIVTNNLKTVVSKLDSFFSGAAPKMDKTVMDDLQNSMTDISVNITKIGDKLNRLDLIRRSNDEIVYTSQKRVSALEDVDMAKAAADFSKAQTAYQASLKTQATIQQISLFNYIS